VLAEIFLVVLTSLASAQDDPAIDEAPDESAVFPVRFAERPLTLPALMLRPDFDLLLRHQPTFTSMTGPIEPDPFFGIAFGAGFGILDDLEVGAQLVPISFSPVTRFGRPPEITGLPWFYGRSRFLTEPFELGAEARIYLPVPEGDRPDATINADFGADVAVLARFHLSDMVRLDASVFLRFALLANPEEAAFGLGFPIELAVSPVEFIFAGVGVAPLIDRFEAFVLPVTLFVGGTIEVDGAPLFDITGRFGLPLFIVARETDGGVSGDPWELGVTARGYFQL
jgi:hypothetical protein